MNKKKKGFTLIELIVVIAILGILAAVAVPRLSAFTESARQASDKEAAAVVANAMAMYVANHQSDASWTMDISATGVNIANLQAAGLITAADLDLESTYYATSNPITDTDLSINAAGQCTVTLDGAVDYVITK